MSHVAHKFANFSDCIICWMDSDDDAKSISDSLRSGAAANPLKLSNDAYLACLHLHESYMKALSVLKTPVAKVPAADFSEIYATKQQKFQRSLSDILTHFHVIKANHSVLKKVFPEGREAGQKYLLEETDDVVCFDSFSEDETSSFTDEKRRKREAIENLQRQIELEDAKLEQLRSKLLNYVNS